MFTPLTDYAPSGVAQSSSGEAQPYLPHVTRRVQSSVHAKFHADWTKTVGARGMQTDRQTDRQTNRQSYFNNIDRYCRFKSYQIKWKSEKLKEFMHAPR